MLHYTSSVYKLFIGNIDCCKLKIFFDVYPIADEFEGILKNTYFQAECPCGNYGCFGVCKYKTIPFKCLQNLSADSVAEKMI